MLCIAPLTSLFNRWLTKLTPTRNFFGSGILAIPLVFTLLANPSKGREYIRSPSLLKKSATLKNQIFSEFAGLVLSFCMSRRRDTKRSWLRARTMVWELTDSWLGLPFPVSTPVWRGLPISARKDALQVRGTLPGPFFEFLGLAKWYSNRFL